jgi:hypothetical protein
VAAQCVGRLELLVALRAGVVVERDVLGHTGSVLELCVTWNRCTTLR